MLKKQITYTNPFTEQPVTEEYYFHISKADLVEIQMESLQEPEMIDPDTGEKIDGFAAKLQRIINSKDGVALMAEVKSIIRRAYGKKDGDRFIKSKEIYEDFAGSEAYSELYYELCTDAEAQAEFMRGVLPSNLEQEAAKLLAETEARAAQQAQASTPTQTAPEPRTLTSAEVTEMDSDDLKSGLAEGRYKLA